MYIYRTAITIDHTKVSGSGDLTNFPVFISGVFDGTGDEADLRSVANGGNVANVDTSGGNSNALSVPADLAFFNDDQQTTQYDHEVEYYNPATGEIAIWVRIPTLDGDANTVFYMFYGDNSITSSQEDINGVWDSNFVAVYHLNNDPSASAPQIKDSTSNNNHLTTRGSMASGDVVTGLAGGKAIDFESGSSQGAYILDASQTGLDLTSAFTMTGYVNPDSSHSGVIMAKEDDSDGAKRQYNWFLSSLVSSVLGKDASTFDFYNDSAGVSAATWNSLGIVANYGNASATTYRFFRGGALIGNGSAQISGNIVSIQNASEPFTLGYRDQANTPDLFYNGMADEYRVSNTNRSDDWVITEFNTFVSPSTFFSMGNEVIINPPVIGPFPTHL